MNLSLYPSKTCPLFARTNTYATTPSHHPTGQLKSLKFWRKFIVSYNLLGAPLYRRGVFFLLCNVVPLNLYHCITLLQLAWANTREQVFMIIYLKNVALILVDWHIILTRSWNKNRKSIFFPKQVGCYKTQSLLPPCQRFAFLETSVW